MSTAVYRSNIIEINQPSTHGQNRDSSLKCSPSGYSAAVARLHGVQEVAGSIPASPTKKYSSLRLVFFCWARAGQLLGLRRGLNAGAICEHQRAWRGGGQPEGSDGDPRGEADPR